MTRREAALILGIREHEKEDAVKDAHRKIMIANHPDAGEAATSELLPSVLPHCTSILKLVALLGSKRKDQLCKYSWL